MTKEQLNEVISTLSSEFMIDIDSEQEYFIKDRFKTVWVDEESVAISILEALDVYYTEESIKTIIKLKQTYKY